MVVRLARPAAAALLAVLLVVGLAGPAAATLRSQQYGLETIRAPQVWPTTRGEGTVVAVVDSGVDLRHPDLAPRLLRDGQGRVIGRDFVDGGAPQDVQGHGTQVAGVIAAAARDATSLAGVAPRTRLMPVRVLDERGAGRGSDVDAGIRWAVDNGADVVNLSLESAVPVPGSVLSSGFDAAVRYAWERGVVVVAAAGNSGTPFTDFAASTPVLLVGATDRDDRRASFSDGSRSDMVMAPGVDVVTTACSPCGADSRPASATVSGTSFAAPHVAGAVALLLSDGRSPAQAVAALRDTAQPVRGGGGLGGNGRGRIDVARAAGLATSQPASPAPTPSSPAPTAPAPSSEPAPAPPAEPATPAGDEPTEERTTDGPSRSDEPTAAPPQDASERSSDEPAEDTAADRTTADDASPEPGDLADAAPPPRSTTPVAGGAVAVGEPRAVRIGALEVAAAVLLGVTGVLVGGALRREGAASGP